MRSATRELYVKYNQEQKQSSGSNYLKLLRTVVRCRRLEDPESPFILEVERFVRKPIDEIDWQGLLDYADYLSSLKHSTADQHFTANQLALLIRKYPAHKLKGLDPKAKALQTFMESEQRCKETNERLLTPGAIPFYASDALERARAWIRYVIGERPPLGKIVNECGFTPGASLGVHGNATNLARKMLSAEWSCTPKASWFALRSLAAHAQVRELLCAIPGKGVCYDPEAFRVNFRDKVSWVNHNKITFVPKTAKTHRSIAVEPLLNSYVQKGVDTVLKNLLKRVGLPLDDQERNAQFARKGSECDGDGGFATIDLSAASDSVSIELVRYLLPEEWFVLLDDLRSPAYKLPGEDRPRKAHKFCSMGNGFNFPLQVLVYASLIHALDGHTVFGRDAGVYGDDIAVRPTLGKLLIPLLGELGFKVNEEKSFLEGPFRESCGQDWYRGVNVRPYTLDFELDSLESVFKLLNGVQKTPLTTEFFRGLSLDTFKVPEALRYVRPYPGPDDGAVTVPFDLFISSPYAKFNRRTWGWGWRELLHESVEDRVAFTHPQIHHAVLYGALSGATSERMFTLRRKTRTKEVLVTSAGAHSTWLPRPH